MIERHFFEKLFKNDFFSDCLTEQSQATIVMAIHDMYDLSRKTGREIDFIFFLEMLREYDLPLSITADVLIDICFNVFSN